MAQEVKIIFSIEGLEAYIDDLTTLNQVLDKVTNATNQASTSTEELEAAQNKAKQATSDSIANSEEFETRLNTMEGGVKVLAGGFEALAGAASLLGLEDNPFFKELSENVLGILALSRGAIDAAEGVRLLAQNQKLATAAQAAFNAVANANPYVLLATAIIALGGALLLYSQRTKDTTEDTKKKAQALRDLQTELDKTTDFERKLAEAKGEFDDEAQIEFNRRRVAGIQEIIDKTTDEIAVLTRRYSELSDEEKTELQGLRDKVTENTNIINQLNQENILIDIRSDKKKKDADQEKEAERQREANRRAEERRNAQRQLEAELTLKAIEDERERELEILRRKYEEDIKLAEGNKELLILIEEQFLRDIKNLNDKFRIEFITPLLTAENYFPKEEFETTAQRLARLRQEIFDTKELIISTNTQIGTSSGEVADAWAVSYKKAFDSIIEEPGKAADLLRRDVKAAIDFANNLNTIFTKDNEKRAERTFKLGKALSLSTAVINTAEAITTALTDKTQPSTILRILQTAAVAAAGAAQIATIARQKFTPSGSGGNPGINNLTPSIPQFNPQTAIDAENRNLTGLQNPGGEIVPGQRTEPVRAYVISTEVQSSLEANNHIEKLSRL